MIYLKKILVTTDLSPLSLAALEYAVSFGLLYSSQLFLMYVVDDHHAHADDATAALETFVRKNVSPDIDVTPVIRTGHASEEIRKFADAEGMDLIVMATHGRTGVRHVVMGSIAEKVVRCSHVPVLTVKPRPVREHLIRNEDIEKELHLR
jgi:nucleotide-binding universal stress UspA family protein